MSICATIRACALVLLAALLVGCAASPDAGAARRRQPPQADPYFRAPGTRDHHTIFSALDLPAPSPIRTARGLPGPAYWQQRADYVIHATLDAENRSISAREVITYTNNSPDDLDFLWIHLEQNLFKPESLGGTTAGRGRRFGNRDGFEGGFEIHAVRMHSESDAPGDLPFHVYDTLARLDLPEPVKARGGTCRIEIHWSFKIPPYGSDRLAVEEVEQGVIFQVAQWFPAVAVYDDVHGWNTLPYLGQGEFYTNFGDYEVHLTVPRSHIVAGSGWLMNPREVLTPAQVERLEQAARSPQTVLIRGPEEVSDPASRPEGDGPLTWVFKAADIRTFAFASSDAFIWDAAGIERRGPTSPEGSPDFDAAMPPGTLVQSLYPKEGIEQWSKSTDMLRSAIEGYNARWFEYPYPVATNVNGRVGGMEYPMIIFCRARDNERALFGVTTHEIGHNWFPMVVSTDERRHAWMDEGFNTFINYYSVRERYPDTDGGRGDARAFVDDMLLPDQQPMEIPADHCTRLGMMQYAKPAVALVLLREHVLGPDRFDDAFRRYIRAWAFRSPRPADFFRCIEDAAGMDLAWFWRGWILETGTLDQAVAAVDHQVDDQSGTLRRVTVSLTNNRELVMPVVMRVTYDDASSEVRRLPVEIWLARDRFDATWNTRGRRVTEVLLDPDEAFPDADPANNRWPR